MTNRQALFEAVAQLTDAELALLIDDDSKRLADSIHKGICDRCELINGDQPCLRDVPEDCPEGFTLEDWLDQTADPPAMDTMVRRAAGRDGL